MAPTIRNNLNQQLLIDGLNKLSVAQQQQVIDLITSLQLVNSTSNQRQPDQEGDRMNVTINLYQVLGKSDLTLADEGQIIYTLITQSLAEGKTVVLSFANVQRITWSFVRQAIGQLYEHFSVSQIESNVSFIDLAESDREFINHVIETKKEFVINPAKFQQPMSEDELEKLRQKNPHNSILKVVGIFTDDPTFDEMLSYINTYRQQLDEEYFKQLDQEGETHQC